MKNDIFIHSIRASVRRVAQDDDDAYDDADDGDGDDARGGDDAIVDQDTGSCDA